MLLWNDAVARAINNEVLSRTQRKEEEGRRRRCWRRRRRRRRRGGGGGRLEEEEEFITMIFSASRIFFQDVLAFSFGLGTWDFESPPFLHPPTHSPTHPPMQLFNLPASKLLLKKSGSAE
jgi:hypothetical protein